MKLKEFLIYTLIFFLPTQLGKHFFFPFSYISGVKIDYLAPSFYITDCIFILLFLLSLQKINIQFSKKITILIIFITFNIIFSLSPWISIYKWIKFIEIIALFHALNIELKSKFILISLVASSVIQLSLVLYQMVNHHSLQGIAYFLGERYFSISTPGIAKVTLQGIEVLRGYGTFSHPNSMGGFYVFFYTFILFDKRFNSFLKLKYLFLGISSILIFLSFSKIAIFTFLIITIYYASKYITCKLCAFGRIIILLILSLIFLSAKGDPESFEKRIFLIKNSLVTFIQHPIAGTGNGAYLLAQIQFPTHYPYLFIQPVHNIFILALVESGFPLFVFSIFLLIPYIKRNLNSMTFRMLLLVVLVTGFFDHYWLTLQQNLIAIPVVFALLKNQKGK
jgi:hypothetical protein